MAIEKVPGQANVPPTPQEGWSLGKQEAMLLAHALGLLGTMGTAFTKAMKGSLAGEKAISRVAEAIKRMMNKTGSVSGAEFEKSYTELLEALKELAAIAGGDNDYMQGWPEGEGIPQIKADLKAFLESLINDVADLLEDETVCREQADTSGKANFAWGGKYLAKMLRGETLTPAEEAKAKQLIDQWQAWWGKTGELMTNLMNRVTQANQQWSQYSVRAKLVTTNADRLLELTQKSVDIQAKTISGMSQKF
jgi:hypothetical protein